MTMPPGRRERKKAATRQKIADAAMQLFQEHGFDAVGIRDIAAEADVAVTTLFLHFPSKEAMVFEQDEDVEQRLTQAVTHRVPQQPLIPALRQEIHRLVQHCASDDRASIWHMISASPTLQKYDESMRLRHAETLARAIEGDPDLSRTATACRTIARFVIDAYSLAREAADPQAALDEIFRMIEAAWEVTDPSRPALEGEQPPSSSAGAERH